MAEARHRSAGGAAATGQRVSAEALMRATGRTRAEWFGLLDAWGGAERAHKEIALWLSDTHGVDGWWAQSITVDYEQARGLRAPGQRRGAGFEANASKTIAVPVARLFAAFHDPKLRRGWLPDADLRERTSQTGRSARFDWEDGATRVIVAFESKGADKSQVAVTHERLPDAAAAAAKKAYWRERLAGLKDMLES
jgi:uncharacterized protein YndB with AHSA1/START domain